MASLFDNSSPSSPMPPQAPQSNPTPNDNSSPATPTSTASPPNESSTPPSSPIYPSVSTTSTPDSPPPTSPSNPSPAPDTQPTPSSPQASSPSPKFKPLLLIFIFIIFALIGGGVYAFLNPSLLSSLPISLPVSFPFITSPSPAPTPTPSPSAPTTTGFDTQVEKFTSLEDFQQYLTSVETDMGYFGFGGGALTNGFKAFGELGMPDNALRAPVTSESATPDRVSQTNVQVVGIDEPDIVKTDGQSIFYSARFDLYRTFEPLMLEERIMPPNNISQLTRVLKAWPPADLSSVSQIDRQGQLLLQDQTLVIFSGKNIIAYNISDPASPTQKWTFDLDSNQTQVAARLFNDQIYLITRTQTNTTRPCPIPLTADSRNITIACDQIYHPVTPVPVDSTFTAFVLDPQTGDIKNKISFVGTQSTSIVYMSSSALYITYTYYVSMFDFYLDFFLDQGKDLVSDSTLARLEKVRSYDLSSQAKLIEYQTLWQQELDSLDQDERRRVENEYANRFSEYTKAHARDLEKSGLVRISNSDLSIQATGAVPGIPLNQFSLDEYADHLRIATTTSGRWGWGAGESVNDVYVLDSNLNISGKITDLGLTERVYSARFIQDKGYLVTFRQTDPFYVLDLSDPANPVKKGELKIPGYSSYLHPISQDLILGVGKEGSQVKLSLFNVSDPANPTEQAKYLLDEYWTDVLNTHHAFLLDSDHSIFFLPGSQGGYVFSYADNNLQLARVVSDIQAQRALYLEDYLYIVGRDKLVILNQQDWTEVNQLAF